MASSSGQPSFLPFPYLPHLLQAVTAEEDGTRQYNSMGLSLPHMHPTKARALQGFATACFSIHRGDNLAYF